jgi:hypothetical protein
VLNLELQPHVGKVYPLEWHKRGFSFVFQGLVPLRSAPLDVPRDWRRLLSQGAAWGPYPAYVHLRSIQTLSHLYTSTYFSRICKTL